MTSTLRIRAETCPRIPWKNGAGLTRELAIGPDGANIANFHWRLSIAEITGAAPFSRFEGMERSFTVLSGTVRLNGPWAQPAVIEAADPAFVFSGDADVSADIDAPPAIVFNAMFDPRECRLRVGRSQTEMADCDELVEVDLAGIAASGMMFVAIDRRR